MATIKKAAKKAAVKGTVIKYADKSAGQPELVPIFENIKKVLKKYAKPTLHERDGTGSMYHLLSKKQPEILGKVRELFFASAMVQKGFVGFYFFPVYTDPEIAQQLQPELLKCLKGKSCFHIKKNDSKLMDQIEEALEIGYELYEKKGWV